MSTVLFQATQFSSIWPIDRTLSSATTLSQSGPGSDGNEGKLHIPQSSSITGTSPSDCLVSYPRQSSGEVLPLEMQSVYSTAYHPTQPTGQNLLGFFSGICVVRQFFVGFPVCFFKVLSWMFWNCLWFWVFYYSVFHYYWEMVTSTGVFI